MLLRPVSAGNHSDAASRRGSACVTSANRLSGGVCIKATQVNPFTVEVRADGVPLATDIAILSPDATNNNGQTSLQSGAKNCGPAPAPGGFETRVGLSDAVYLTTPFATGTYDACADLNGVGGVTLGDAGIATQFIVNSNNCSCTP